ncbi:MAG: hypothetical protein ABI585_02470 [Betaproteobacteria bacterium]
MKNPHRPQPRAADPLSPNAGEGAARLRSRSFLASFAVGALACTLAFGAAAQSSGGRAGPSLGAPKIDLGELTYDSFSGFNCTQLGFFTDAVAHLTISGPVRFEGIGTLDGVAHDSYAENLGNGPDTFPSDFSRNFTLVPPAPSSSTYTYVYDSTVFRANLPVGRSVTTIRCNDGAFSASNVWIGEGEPIPATGGAAAFALAFLLLATALARLRPARA